MSEPNIAKGRCLCGAVTLSATNINHHIAACHCSMCRQWGGGALFGVECEHGVSFSGEENIRIYQSSEWAERGFCQKCGSHLFYKLKDKNHYFIPAGIFENDENFVFDLQVFIEEKPKYYSFANDTQKVTGSELFDLFESSPDK